MMLVDGARQQHAIDGHRRQAGRRRRASMRDAIADADAIRIDDLVQQLARRRRRRRPRRRRRAEARELRGDLPQQPHLRQDRVDAVVEHRRQRLRRDPAWTRRRCSAESWIGVSGFLMSCATWRAISAHASRRCVRSSWLRWRCSSPAMRLNASTSRRSSSAVRDDDARARDRRRRCAASRASAAAPDRRCARPSSSRGRRRAGSASARRAARARSSVVDLALDLALARAPAAPSGSPSSAADAHRRRRHQVGEVADAILADVGRQPLDGHGAVAPAAGVRVGSRPEANRSRSLVTSSSRAVEDVDVLVDQAADPHHHVVVQAADRGAGELALLQRERLLDDAPAVSAVRTAPASTSARSWLGDVGARRAAPAPAPARASPRRRRGTACGRSWRGSPGRRARSGDGPGPMHGALQAAAPRHQRHEQQRRERRQLAEVAPGGRTASATG